MLTTRSTAQRGQRRGLAAALLSSLVLLAACERTTEPEHPQAAELRPSALLTLPVRTVVDFDDSFYGSIDVLRAAQSQYGSLATVTSVSNHLYGWRAVVGGRQYSIDLKRAVADQWGSGYVLGAVGAGLYDWRAVRWSGISNRVIPVLVVSSDLFFDVDGVRQGLANFKSVLLPTRNWYDYRLGESFHYLQPLIVPLQSTHSSADWNYLSSITQYDETRYALLDSSIAEFRRSYPNPSSSQRVVIVPFSGASPDVWLGAASTGSFAVSPQRASSITCAASGPLDARCSDATYALGHELGHTFGLKHSCDAYPNDSQCTYSIMQVGKPWNAILLPGEMTTLQASPFFW